MAQRATPARPLPGRQHDSGSQESGRGVLDQVPVGQRRSGAGGEGLLRELTLECAPALQARELIAAHCIRTCDLSSEPERIAERLEEVTVSPLEVDVELLVLTRPRRTYADGAEQLRTIQGNSVVK